MPDEELRRLYANVVAGRTAAERLACVSPEGLRRVAEREGSEAERLLALDHIGQCAACQADLEFFRVAQGAPPVRRRPVLAGLAAAAAIVLVATLLWRARPQPADELRGGGDTLALVAPAGPVPGGHAPRFVWRAVPRATSYAFELLDDRAAPVFQASIPDTSLLLPDSVPLTSGRDYSWRVSGLLPSGGTATSAFLTFSLQAP